MMKLISLIKKKSKTKDVEKHKDKQPVSVPEAAEKKQYISTRKLTIDSGYRRVVVRPWVTEKARDLSKEGTYVFLVTTNANKHMVRNEIEHQYGVSVVSVRIILGKHRSKRFAGRKGHARMYKKALVSLAQGQKLDIFPV